MIGGGVAVASFHFADIFHEAHEIVNRLVDFVGGYGHRYQIGDL